MVDVGAKAATKRVAVAEALLAVKSETLEALREGRLAKGDALSVARIAGIRPRRRPPTLSCWRIRSP